MGIVFSSESLGIFGHSLSSLSGKQIGQSNESVFVNAATGNLVIQNKDEQVAGLGQGLGVVRTYNSEGHFDGDNNDQWRLGFLKKIVLEGAKNSSSSVVIRTTADGFEQRFSYDTARKLYVSKSGTGADDTLQYTSSGAVLKQDGTQAQELYDTSGRLTAIESAQDHKTTIQYSSSTGRVAKIITKTETGTETTALLYNAQGLLEKLEVQSGTSKAYSRVYYGYDTQKRLSSIKIDLTPEDNKVSDGNVYETKYTYHGSSKRVHTVSQSDGTSLTISYEAHGSDFRVKTLTDGEGNQTSYDYVSANHTAVTLGGVTTDYFFDNNKRLTSVARIEQHQIVKEQYSYDANGRLSEIKNGLGHSTHFEYDAHGNITKQTDADGVTVTRTYNSDNQLLTEQTGQNITRNIYGSNQRLRFSIDAEGGVVEYNYNALGQRTAQRVYTELKYTGNVFTESALAQFVGTVVKQDQELTQYDYDFRGQLNTLTRYSDVNAQGAGTGVISTTMYVYDIHGRLLKETRPQGSDQSTSYSYDGLGRILTKTESNKAVTAYSYDDANQRIGTHFANGLWQTAVYDKAGMLVSQSKGNALGADDLGVERFYHDTQGRVVAQQNAQGARSYVFYDDVGNRAATVNSLGKVTRYWHDNAGKQIQVTEFATLLSTSGWLNSAGGVTKTLDWLDSQLNTMANHADNRTRYTLYTPSGKPEYNVDADGFATQFIYNELGQLVEEKRYKTALSSSALKRINQPILTHQWDNYDASPAGATMTPTFDADYGAQVMVLKGSGKENGYRLRGDNRVNWQSEQRTISWDMKYAEAYTIFISVNTTAGHRYITYNQGAKSPYMNGQYAHHFLDVDTTSGKWTTVTRDLVADLAAVQPNVTITNINGFLVRGSGRIGEVRLSGLNAQASARDAISKHYQYNANGQVEYTTNGDGYVTRFYYDQAGNEIAQRQYKNTGTPGHITETADDLISHTFYNQQSQVVGKLSSIGALTTFEYDKNGQKITETQYLTQVKNHVIGSPLSVPNGTTVRQAWTYTSLGQIETHTKADGGLDKFTYDKVGNLVHRQTFESSSAAGVTQTNAVDDFNDNAIDGFTVSGNTSNSIEVANGKVKYTRLASAKSEWPSIISKQSFELADNVSTSIEVTTGSKLSGMYFYGGLDNSGSWAAKTLDRHAVYFDGVNISSGVVRNGITQGYKPLLALSENTTYVVNWSTTEKTTTLTVYPKGQPHEAVSVTETTKDWSNRAKLRFYNNPRPGASNAEVYVDNYKLRSLNEVSSTRYQYDLLGRQVATLDGNALLGDNRNHPVDTANWEVYDPTPAGAIMQAQYDAEYGAEVLTVSGSGKNNGYRLRNSDRTNWDAQSKTISWDMKYAESYTVYISVATPKGHRYITYNPSNSASSISNGYAHISLPTTTTNGQWHTITRDLEADLKSVEPDNHITNVSAFLIRGSGSIGKITLSDIDQAELTRRGITTGTSLTQGLTGAFAAQGDHTQYDVLGNIVSYTDKVGAKTRYFYDAQGNQRFEVDAQGQVTEYRYNGFNERTDVLRHHTPLTEAQIESVKLKGGLITNRLANGQTIESYLRASVSQGDAFHERVDYDARGLVEKQIDAQGYETTFEYNAFAQLVKQSQQTHFTYADKLGGNSRKKTVVSSLEYNGRGLLLSTTERYGSSSTTTSQTYDAFGRVLTQTDANGSTLTNHHTLNIASDHVGRVVTMSRVVDGATRRIETQYDMLGRKLLVEHASGHTTAYAYDDASNSMTVTQADGSSVTTTRNALGLIASVEQLDRIGQRVSLSEYHYDKNGNLTETYTNGKLASLTQFDRNDRVHLVTDGAGRQVETHYDKVGRVIANVVDPDGLKLTTTFSFEKHGSKVTKTEQIKTVISGGTVSAGTPNVTQTIFDAKGRARSVTTMQGSTVQSKTEFVYNAAGDVLKTVDGSGAEAVSKQYEYDAFGRLIKTQQGDEITRYSYDKNDNLIKKVELLGSKVKNDASLGSNSPIDDQRISYFVYNESNQRIAEFTSSEIKYRSASSRGSIGIVNPIEPPVVIDPITPPGEVMSVSSGAQISSALVSQSGGAVNGYLTLNGSAKYFDYDVNGNLIATHQLSDVLEVGHTEFSHGQSVSLSTGEFSYTNIANALAGAKSKNKISHYTAYDENGRKSLSINADGGVTQWVYDAQGRVFERINWGQRATINASGFSKLAQGTLVAADLTRSGAAYADQKIKSIYDQFGRVHQSIQLLEGNTASLTQNDYDAAGKLVKTTRYATAVSYNTVIDSNAPINKPAASAQDQASHMFYDAAGRLRFTVDALGFVTEQRYNEVNDIISSIEHNTSVLAVSSLQTKYTNSELSYSDLVAQYGASVLTGARVSEAAFNALGKLTWQRHADGTTESYTYNTRGEKTSHTNQKGATWTYDYDNTGRLSYERSPSQTIHNWSNGSLSTLDGVNVTKRFEYDGLGNVIKITEGAQKNKVWQSVVEKAVTHFEYDNAGRQTGMRQEATRNSPATESITKYDALGRAIRSTKGADLSQAVSETNPHVTQLKIYDSVGNVRFEVSGDGNITERRYNALGQAVQLIKYADETTVRTGQNHNIVLSDMVNSGGAIVSDNPLNLQVNASKDRSILTTYDAAGRKQRVNIGNQSTQFTYNAFGQEIKSEKLLSGSFDTAGYRALTNYTYYNGLGQKEATVDAGKFLTTWNYDAFGAVKTHTEYAVALTGSISGTSVPTGQAGNSTYGQNRVTEYHYDDMGRVLHTVQSNVNIADFTHSANFEFHSHLISSFEYDALGNTISSQKRTANTGDLSKVTAQTFDKFVSEYDAVGRLIHTASESVAKTELDTSQLQSQAINIKTGRRYTTMAYDAFGNMVKRTEHANSGSVSSSTLDITAPSSSNLDKVTQHEYNVRGQLIAEYDALGSKITHRYNALGQLIETRQSYNEWNHANEHYSFSYQYYHFDRQGNYLSSSSKVGGLPVGVSFNETTGVLSGGIHFISLDDGIGGYSTVTITLEANYLSSDSAKRQTRSFNSKETNKSVSAFSSWRKPHTGNDETKQRYTKYYYNENGQIERKTLGHNDGDRDGAVKSYYTYYNAFGEVKKDEEGRYLYNNEGLLWKTSKGDGVLKTYSYDNAGRLTSNLHALNGLTEITRDALGNATLIKQPHFTQNGQSIRPQIEQTFDRWGNVIEVVDAHDFVTKMAYNHNNQLIQETLPTVAVTDENGETTAQTPINLYHYDEAGRLIQKVDGNNHTQTYKYDEAGNQTLIKDGEGHLTYHHFDNFGRKVVTQDAEGKVTTTTYDKLDRVVETGQFGVINNVSGTYRAVNSYDYDELGNRTHERDALGGEKSYKFDMYGNVIYSRDEVGREKVYQYNSDGTQRSETYLNLYSNSEPDKDKNYRYFDSYGNLQRGNDLGGKDFNYTYGRNFGSTKVKTLNSSYQEAEISNIGRLIHKQNDHGQNIEYRYYDNGWLKSITDKTTDAYSYFEYDKAGRRTLELRQSWDDLQRVIRHETKTDYDSHGRISLTQTQEYNNTKTTGTPNWVKGKILSRVTYRYDAVGNRRSMRVENGITGEISANPSHTFYGTLLVNENQTLNSTTGSVAQFFDALQISGLAYSAQIFKQNTQGGWDKVSTIDGISLNTNGLLVGTPSYESAGVYRLDVEAKDNSKSPAPVFKGEIRVNVSNVQAPIETKPISAKSVREGYSVSIDLSSHFVADSASRQLKYVIKGLPSSLSYNQSGVISGKLGYKDAGTRTITVEVSDKNNASIKRTEQFTLRVSDTPYVTVEEEGDLTITVKQSNESGVHIRRLSSPSFAVFSGNTLKISPSASDGRSAPYIIKYEKYMVESEPGIEPFETSLGTYEYHVSVPDTKVVNQPLTARNGTLSYREGQALSNSNANVKGYFTNPDNDSLSYVGRFLKRQMVQVGDPLEPHYEWRWVISSPPEGVSFNRAGYIQGTLGSSSSGNYRLEVIATETNRRNPNTATAVLTLNVANVKPPISTRTIPNKESEEGQTFTYNISSYFTPDSSSRVLEYSATGLPSGVSINKTTGVISSSGVLKDGTAKGYTINVTATDKNNRSITASSTFSLRIKNIDYVTINEGQTRSLNIANVGGTYSGITKRLIGAPAWVKVSNDKRTLTLTPGASDGRSSAYSFTLEVSEYDHELRRNFVLATKKYVVKVNDTQTPNRRPAGTIDNKTVSEGSYFSHNVASKFKDPDGDALTYTATFYKHEYDPGPIDLRSVDLRSPVSPQLSSALIEGEERGPDSNPITDGGSWVWKRVSKPSGLSFSSSGVLSGTPSYSSSGKYKVVVVATEQKSTKLSASADFELKINNVVPNKAPTVSLSGATSVKKGSSVTFTATGRDTDGSVREYQWQKSSGVSLSGSGSRVAVKGITGGNQWVKVRVKDDDGAWSSWTTRSITVTTTSATNRAPVSNGNLHKFMFADDYLYYTIPSNAFTDPDGDTLTYTATNLPRGVSLNGNRISGKVTSPGQYGIKITAKDPKGLSASLILNLEVEPSFDEIPFISPFSSARSLQFDAAPMAASSAQPQANIAETESVPMLSRAEPAVMQRSALASVSTASASAQSTSADNVDEYWFTYDGNNRVIHDGGGLVNGQITTKAQGQYIAYNDVGQQALLISANNRGAQQFIYNSWGQMAAVDSYQNKANINLYDARATLSANPSHANWVASSRFEYDALGRVTDKRDYFSASSSRVIHLSSGGDEDPRHLAPQAPSVEDNVWVTVNYGGAIKNHTETRYNAAGEVVWVQEKGLNINIESTLKQYASPYLSGEEIYVSEPWSESNLSVNSITQNYLYDGAGNVRSYAYYQKRGLPSGVTELIHNFSKRYEARESYLESLTTGTGSRAHKDSQNLQDAQTKSSYDANGNRTRIEEHITDSRYQGDKDVNARYMRYDAEGKLISKVTGQQTQVLTSAHLNTKRSYYNPRSGEVIDWETTVAQNVGFKEDENYLGRETGSYYLYSSSNYLGELSKTGSNSIKEQHFSAPDSKTSSVMARHQVQAGDTLKGIAKLYYGNENLWYIIADLNGLGAGSELQPGVMLDIPSRANAFNS
ncbi:putative Ig domain-containing protein, partial [Pseudoalteromonas sp. SMS1]|uniref:putative Ig domain-containing protein n=1 Tax=Pseudoalteromonas sp. SMS1 TaxID=2908894 RepID=UPI001F4926E5